MHISTQAVSLRQLYDDVGLLVFADGELCAVFSQLSQIHERHVGQWFMEMGFGALREGQREFASLTEALDWIRRELAESDWEIVTRN